MWRLGDMTTSVAIWHHRVSRCSIFGEIPDG
jgi:hypothetical protein